jgi:hypothetical protein
MTGAEAMTDLAIKVGMIAEQTGPLSFMGCANANVAKMVIDDINASGGLLGRKLDLYLEDGATTDSVAAAAATKLVRQVKVDVLFGGIYSSTRQAIKGPAVVEGKTLYLYPEQYEGQECDPLLFCTGPVPAQQLDPLIPWLMQKSGAKKFYLPSADYIWPHIMNKRVRELVTANGGTIVGEEYYPLDHMQYGDTVRKIMASSADAWCSTRSFRRDLYRSSSSCTTPASRNEADSSSAPTSTRTSWASCRPDRRRGSTAASITTRTSQIPSARRCSTATTRASPTAISSPAAARFRASTGQSNSGRRR